MKKYTNNLLIIIFVIFELFLLSKSQLIIINFRKTLNICLYNLMPTMFFSILFTQILIKLNFYNYFPKFTTNFFKKIFNINDNEVIIFFLSMLSGYPNNSKMLLNNENLNNIIHYTNFVNPIFLIGTVGSIYLKNIKISIIILISQYISNIIIGIILRNKNIHNNSIKSNTNDSFFNIYYSSLNDTIYTISTIFSNILFFSIILTLFTNIFHIKEPFNSTFIGLIEFSKGIYNISKLNINIFLKGLFILIIITFGSFSIHMQIVSINDKIKYIKYFFFRILNVFISIIIYVLLITLI